MRNDNNKLFVEDGAIQNDNSHGLYQGGNDQGPAPLQKFIPTEELFEGTFPLIQLNSSSSHAATVTHNALLETAARVAEDLGTAPTILPMAKDTVAITVMAHAERAVNTVSRNTTEVSMHAHTTELLTTTATDEASQQSVVGEIRTQKTGLTAHTHRLTHNGHTLVGRQQDLLPTGEFVKIKKHLTLGILTLPLLSHHAIFMYNG